MAKNQCQVPVPAVLILADVVDQLHKPSKKVNSVVCFTRHLNKGIPLAAMNIYLAARKWTPSDPDIHIDDSDV